MNILRNLNIFTIASFLIKITLIFALSFIWLNYYIKDTTNAIILSTLVTLVLNLIIGAFTNAKYKKKTINKNEEDYINNIFFTLILNDQKTNVKYFKTMLNKKNKIETNDSSFILNNEYTIIPIFKIEPLKCDDIISQIKKHNINEKFIILANEIPPETILVVNKILKNEILFYDKIKIYKEIIKPNSPKKIELNKQKSKNKITISDIFKLAITRKKSKSYLIISIILLLSSFIVKNNLYYIIFSSFVFVLSLISIYSSKFYKSEKKNIFN